MITTNEHIRGHMLPRNSIAANQVMGATVILLSNKNNLVFYIICINHFQD